MNDVGRAHAVRPGLAVETHGLGKRYGTSWALRDCSIEVPEGRVSGLVGANGAGKTTLMRLLVGLSRPTTGAALVAGRAPADDPTFLGDIGYLAQEVPLYRRWTAADHLALGAHMNRVWDGQVAHDRLRHLEIPLDRPMEALSGGMRAQVALALALGKRPSVLLLDEPVAALDPLARREFLGSLAGAVADGGVTVLMSSHLLADLERVCDHLVLLVAGRVALTGDVDDLLSSHHLLTGPRRDISTLPADQHAIEASHTERQTSVLVRTTQPILDPSWTVTPVSLDDLVLAYMRQARDGHPQSPTMAVAR